VLAVKRRSWFVTTSVSSKPFKAALAKPRGERKSSESLDHAVRQLVAKAIVPEGEIIDVFSAAGLKQPDISILSDQFLAEVRGLKFKNVAAELLAKLLGDEIKVRSERNLVQSREFSEMLKKTLNAYHNRAIATQEVIEELRCPFGAEKFGLGEDGFHSLGFQVRRVAVLPQDSLHHDLDLRASALSKSPINRRQTGGSQYALPARQRWHLEDDR
jgi:hypothetical protein